MLKNINNLHEYDILLYKATGGNDPVGNIINFLQFKGKYCHASMYRGHGLITESHASSGVVRKKLNEKWYPYIDVFRLTTPLTAYQKKKLNKALNDAVGTPYNFLGLEGSFVHSTLRQLFKIKKSKPEKINLHSYFCSQLIAVKLWEACKVDLRPDLDVQDVSPTDISYSKLGGIVQC